MEIEILVFSNGKCIVDNTLYKDKLDCIESLLFLYGDKIEGLSFRSADKEEDPFWLE